VRILFAGSPGIAVPALEAVSRLADADDARRRFEFELAGILTNPDSPKGRHGTPEPTPVGAAAAALAEKRTALGRPPFPVLKPEKLDVAARSAAAAAGADLLVSFAYGRLFGPKFLALFPLGGINIHPSLLPRYRGPTPIPQAILNGDAETGITIQRLAAEMDSGDILVQERFPLGGRETTASLSEDVARRAAVLLPETLRGIAAGTLSARPQDHAAATYCGLLSRDDGRIDWTKSAAEIDAQIRAYTPWPLSWTMHGEQCLYILAASPLEGAAEKVTGTVLGIDKRRGILVQTGDGVLALTVLQYRTRKALDWRAFLNGVRDFEGTRLE
jgi:methionyl-tRNA formyltransferase